MELEDQSYFGVTSPTIEHLGFTYEQCIVPNVMQMFGKGIWLLIGTFGFNYLTRKTNRSSVFHILSLLFGMFMLRYAVFDLQLTYYFILIVIYAMLIIFVILVIKDHFPNFPHHGYVIMATITTSMVLGEIFFPDLETWFRLRGTAMILCMKVVTFGFCLHNKNHMENMLSFFGYAFFPGNILFGPWISYSDYTKMIIVKNKFSFIWLFNIMQLFFFSITMLWLSNCILPMIEWDAYYYSWIHTFTAALVFRTSHYFIIGLSELTMVSSGYDDDDEKHLYFGTNKFTKPLQVEIPRSMLAVVVNWNIPVHKFLKQYVFHESVKVFGKFWAIFLTYFYSSLLHGINLEVAAILLSLGLFSYVEMRIREFLAFKLDACVRSRTCAANCNHKNKGNSYRSAFINDAFTLLTILQLAYTGCLMHNRTEKLDFYESLLDIHSTWLNLGYLFHYIAFIMLSLTLSTA